MESKDSLLLFFQTNNKTKGIGTRKAGKHNKIKRLVSKRKGKIN